MLPFVAVYCIYIFVTAAIGSDHFYKEQYHDLHHHMDDKDLQKTFGVDTREKVPEYELISPYQSDESGNIVSHFLHDQTRPRRSTHEPNVRYFNVHAFGRSMRLNVTQSKPLISSGALVQTVNSDGSTTYRDIPHGAYYTGHVMSDPGSLVAIRGNKGLAGMIRTLKDTFYIQPLPSHLIKNDVFKEGHPHVIYRRSISEEVSSDYYASDHFDRSTNQAKPKHIRRTKRQAPHKFLELALVADNFAISAYGEERMEDHMLTLSHIVTQLYHDSSIGAIKITPVIVRLVLKKDGFGYDASSNKVKRIDALDKWVKENLPHSDKDPGHPDAVVLITRRTTGGIASSRSTCFTTFGTALANDVGLGTAITMAHELAHTMDVSHDGPPLTCANHINIMATTIPSGLGSMKWSACSRRKFQEFLSYRSQCLNDFPLISAVLHEPKKLYGKLTGQIINRDEQCKMVHGRNFYACPQRWTSCGALGCTDNGYSCRTISSPADGTRCGDRHWCINGECVDDGSPVIHGHWSSWSAFSPCTRPCGGGVQSKTRSCTNPIPKNGGRNCIGPNKGHWRICNSQPCPAGSKTFRQLQCEARNPNFHAYITSAQCSLVCRHGHKVIPQYINVKDGTRCYYDPTKKDVCIQGKCINIGCDNGVESGVKRDRCGVCGGDSSKCKFVEKFWNEHCPGWGRDKACPIFEVPVGANSVYVEQDTPDLNLLGVKYQDGRYVIPVPSWSRTVFAAGTTISYYHNAAKDINKIRILGPTTEKLTIVDVSDLPREEAMCIFPGNIVPFSVLNDFPASYNRIAAWNDKRHSKFVPSGYPKTGVKYRMYDPSLSSIVGVKNVQWKVTGWGQCSRKCAIGKQERTVECTRIDDGTYIGDDLCLKKSRKPAAERSCNIHPCQPGWYQSYWSSCSRTCGKGIQNRQIHCRRLISPIKHEILSDSSCRGNKPTGETKRSCNAVNCQGEWKPSAWSKCSSTCHGGVKKRSLRCKRRNDEGMMVLAPDVLCYHAPKPQITINCNAEVPCPTSAPLMRYKGLGCFNDGQPHAIAHLVKSFRSSIDWSNMHKTINACAEYVYKHYPEYKVFGIQFYGECWSGGEAEYSYNNYGPSEDCWNNVGKEHSYYVYSFV